MGSNCSFHSCTTKQKVSNVIISSSPNPRISTYEKQHDENSKESKNSKDSKHSKDSKESN